MSKKLLDIERVGGVTHKTYHHDDTKFTVETTQDVEPVFRDAKEQAQNQNPKSGFRFKASIPFTLLEQHCRKEAERCGMRAHELVAEVIRGHTDRAKRIWKTLSEERDFNKLHAKTYR